jgi:hypothetical protein
MDGAGFAFRGDHKIASIRMQANPNYNMDAGRPYRILLAGEPAALKVPFAVLTGFAVAPNMPCKAAMQSARSCN